MTAKREDGFKRLSTYGYVQVKSGNKFVFEHRDVMEKKLKRRLKPSEIVHHIDGNKQNNLIENLVITTRPDHARQHYIEDPSKQAQWNSMQHLGAKSLIKVQKPRPKPTETLMKWNDHKNRRGYETMRCHECGIIFWTRNDSKAWMCKKCCPGFSARVRAAKGKDVYFKFSKVMGA